MPHILHIRNVAKKKAEIEYHEGLTGSPAFRLLGATTTASPTFRPVRISVLFSFTIPRVTWQGLHFCV